MATLTYDYAGSTAVIGPLARAAEPHSWDLCANHADRITVPADGTLCAAPTASPCPPRAGTDRAGRGGTRSVAVGSESMDGFDDLPPRPPAPPCAAAPAPGPTRAFTSSSRRRLNRRVPALGVDGYARGMRTTGWTSTTRAVSSMPTSTGCSMRRPVPEPRSGPWPKRSARGYRSTGRPAPAQRRRS